MTFSFRFIFIYLFIFFGSLYKCSHDLLCLHIDFPPNEKLGQKNFKKKKKKTKIKKW